MSAPAPGWRPTAALLRVTVLPAGVALAAVLLRRVDLLALAAPLLLAAYPLLRRPTGVPRPRLVAEPEAPLEGADVDVAVPVGEVDGVETVALAVATPGWVRPRRRRTAATVTDPGRDGTVPGLRLHAARWGRWDVGPAVVTASACGGLLRWGPATVTPVRVRVLPLAARFAGATLVPRARGAVGLHPSRRLGEGAEPAGTRPFAPGDRVRRVDWRVSLRARELYVTTTTTERDADVVVLLDARFDAGVSGGVEGRASGVDVGVRAAASLTAFYLGLGDRVGLTVSAGTARSVPPRAGRGQLQRVLGTLLDVTAPRPGGPEPDLAVPPGLDPRALVLLVSPLVGTAAVVRAAALGRAGHTVLVVDTLPDDAGPDDTGPWTAAALRMWRLERAVRTAQLREAGIPVVPWRGPGSLDAVLRDLARSAAAPRGPR